MSILYSNSILDLIIIAVVSVGVAGLAVSLGQWKMKMGLLQRFKGPTVPRHHAPCDITEHSDLSSN
jgi:hypothetical protein